MDDIRTFMYRSSNRTEDHIENADIRPAAIAVQLPEEGASHICLVSTGADADERVIVALAANGLENRVQFKNGFELVDEIN